MILKLFKVRKKYGIIMAYLLHCRKRKTPYFPALVSKSQTKEDYIETAFNRFYYWHCSFDHRGFCCPGRNLDRPGISTGSWLRAPYTPSNQDGSKQRNTQSLNLPRQPGMPSQHSQPGNRVGYLLLQHYLETAREQRYHCCHQAIR